MTNEQIRAELARLYMGRALTTESEAIIALCRMIEALLERIDPDVDALIEKQRGE